MRKIFRFFMLVPLLGASQQKNIIDSFLVFPKVEKSLEFEKAFIADAQKYHMGNWKWRVFEIQSGPDAGGFHVVEGTLSWPISIPGGHLEPSTQLIGPGM